MNISYRSPCASGTALALSLIWAIPAVAQDAPVANGQSSTTGAPAGANDQSTTPATSAAPVSDTDTASSSQIGDVIVTAQRREESLSRVGISVVAVGAEQLQTRGINNPADLAKVVPGFQATSSYGGAPVYTLRGIGFNTPNVAATAPVGIYMDEAAVPYPYMSLGLVYDLERVEVLKGPQGTLYGRNATGGLINYVTAKPTDTVQGGFSLDAGTYQTINASGYYSGPVSDWLRMRVAFNVLNRGEGYQRSVTTGERLGALYSKAMRVTADVGNGGPFSATFTGNLWRRTGDTLAGQAISYDSYNDPATRPFTFPLALTSIQANPTNDRDVDFYSKGRQTQAGTGILHPGPLTDSLFYSGTAKLGYAFSPAVRVQSLTSYQDLRQHDVSDAAGVAADSLEIASTNRIKSFAQELRLIGESDRFDWSVGGYYAHDSIASLDLAYTNENAVITRLRTIAAFALPHPTYTNAQIFTSFGNFRDVAGYKTDVYAGFANAEYKLSDLLKFTLGGRYTKDKTDFTGCTYDTNGGSLALINTVYPLFGVTSQLGANQCYTLNATSTDFLRTPIENKIDQHNFAWRANVDITPSPTTLIYGSVSRGYKSGGFPVIAASSVDQFDPIKQEKLTAYEVGTKLGLFNRAVQFNLAGFYYDYINKQVYGRVLDPIFATLTRIRNVPRSREYGAEAELTWRIVPSLIARASGTYLNSKVLEYSDFTDAGVLTNIRGQPFAYTPKYSGAGTLSYDGPVASEVHFLAEGNVTYQGKSQADAAGLPLFRIADYTLVDGSIGLRAADNSWRVIAYGTNLFDRYYWTGVTKGSDTTYRYPGMPRQIGVRAAFRF